MLQRRVAPTRRVPGPTAIAVPRVEAGLTTPLVHALGVAIRATASTGPTIPEVPPAMGANALARRRPVVRPAVGAPSGEAPRQGPGATGGPVGARVLGPVTAGATLPRVAGGIGVAFLGPPILATSIAGVPVLLVGLGPSMAAPLVVAPAAVAEVATTAAAEAPSAGAVAVKVAVRRRGASPACDAPMAPVLVVEAAQVEGVGPGAAGGGVEGLSGGAPTVRAPLAPSTGVAPAVPAPALAALATSAVLEGPSPTRPSASLAASPFEASPAIAASAASPPLAGRRPGTRKGKRGRVAQEPRVAWEPSAEATTEVELGAKRAFSAKRRRSSVAGVPASDFGRGCPRVRIT